MSTLPHQTSTRPPHFFLGFSDRYRISRPIPAYVALATCKYKAIYIILTDKSSGRFIPPFNTVEGVELFRNRDKRIHVEYVLRGTHCYGAYERATSILLSCTHLIRNRVKRGRSVHPGLLTLARPKLVSELKILAMPVSLGPSDFSAPMLIRIRVRTRP